MRKNLSFLIPGIICSFYSYGQLEWTLVDSLFQPLPTSVHVYRSEGRLDNSPSVAYYVIADLKSKQINFETDTTFKRRLTPSEFFTKNKHPIVVVNTTFFSFATNQNLNMVVKSGRLVSYNIHSLPGRGKDTLTYRHPLVGTIGISKKRDIDIGWTFTDSTIKRPFLMQWPVDAFRDSSRSITFRKVDDKYRIVMVPHGGRPVSSFVKWKVMTAVGGGPVLLQDGKIMITNNEEMKFAGKAIHDKHPRTAIGYTRDNKLIILVVQGRMKGIAEGASLEQLATIMQDLNCVEALNLDGGGSSCMLVNGKETIKPSDPSGQRPIPAVFMITRGNK